MKMARYFRQTWTDSFTAYGYNDSVKASDKCRLDRMSLAFGQYQPNIGEHQQKGEQEKLSTHKLTCKNNFEISKVLYFVVDKFEFKVTDYQKISDCYIVSLHLEKERQIEPKD